MSDKEVLYPAPQEVIERVMLAGDLSRLSPGERVMYYRAVCASLGLNPLTRPFDYIILNGRLTLYARRDATDQLRKLHNVSVTIVSREQVGGLYVVTARATMPDGRTDESIGAVSIDGLRGEALANAMMKAETKAKRRVTLSIVGLGWLDETEVGSVVDAKQVNVDYETGEITESGAAAEQAEAKREENGKTHVSRDKLLRRLSELLAEAQELSDGRRYNPFHLRAHLEKHYGVSSMNALSDEQIIAFGREVADEVDELKRKREHDDEGQ